VEIRQEWNHADMKPLSRDVCAAREAGLSYGYYKALISRASQNAPMPVKQRPKRKVSRRYTDEKVFALWQAGKTDAEIGALFGVSRQIIQRWRDTMELPSTAKRQINTQLYHLVKTDAGSFVVRL